MDPTSLGRTVLTFVLLLCSLGFVTWRQSRALEANRELDDLRRHVSVAQAERVELEREIQALRSRSRIVTEARLLGMHTPGGDEQFILVTQDAP